MSNFGCFRTRLKVSHWKTLMISCLFQATLPGCKLCGKVWQKLKLKEQCWENRKYTIRRCFSTFSGNNGKEIRQIVKHLSEACRTIFSFLFDLALSILRWSSHGIAWVSENLSSRQVFCNTGRITQTGSNVLTLSRSGIVTRKTGDDFFNLSLLPTI